MVGRLEGDKVVFSEIMIGKRRRRRTERPVKPICLENVDAIDFKWLCELPDKRIRDSEYIFCYDPSLRRAYLQIKGPGGDRVLDDYIRFGNSAFYDTITNEITRVGNLLSEFRRNGKIYLAVIDLLKEVSQEL